MSKAFLSFSFLTILTFSAIRGLGQDVEATIEIDFTTPVVKVSGRHLGSGQKTSRRNLGFLRSVAGVNDIANRVSDVRLLNASGQAVESRKLADGEYISDTDFTAWSYKVDLTPLKDRNAAAHTSWFANGTGILMLADLLPQSGGRDASVRITFQTPRRFDVRPDPVYSVEKRIGDSYEVTDPDNAIFYIGNGWENGHSLADPFAGSVLVSGGFNFAPIEATAMAKEIEAAYARLFGSRSSGAISIAIAKFPVTTPPGHWQAETRGNNVTIISSDMNFKTQSLQRLHEQLRHEMFHLWIPNGINLTGNYDWFYEGFALYQSLKLAVALNRIRFEDFLDTLSRAHRIDSIQTRRVSLVEASRSRFNGSATDVYARGMLVAFLSDLNMLQASNGKSSIDTLLKDLFTKHRKPAAPADANATVVALLTSNVGGEAVVKKYVVGAERIEWDNDLSGAGIEDGDPGAGTALRVKAKLTGRQKTVLDKLGYNNWRKLSR